EIHRLHRLVTDHHLDVLRRHRRQRGRREVRDVSGLARDVGGFGEAPEARLQTGVHEIHAHGVSLRYVARPPSSWTTAPVMYAAAGDSRNAATGATSSGVPNRRSGIISVACRSYSGLSPAVMSVRMNPRASAFTVICSRPTSFASALVKPMIPAFDAE